MIYIGTSGYSYADWIGPFYPAGTRKNDFLEFYKTQFSTTELNFTYYRMPDASMLAKIAAKVENGFLFSVKAPGEITHERDGDPRPLVDQFTAALAPLKDESKFACVLLQFPTSFHATQANVGYLRRLREPFGDTPVVVEFRHRDWISEATFDLLRENNLGFCCVDQPQFESLLPPIAVVTSDIAYLRFHGRNAEKWWHHDKAWERYDYMYAAQELQEWVPRLKDMDGQTQLTLVYMNNNWQGKGPASARLLRDLLRQSGAAVI